MIYFTVGGSEEKIHELFYQPKHWNYTATA